MDTFLQTWSEELAADVAGQEKLGGNSTVRNEPGAVDNSSAATLAVSKLLSGGRKFLPVA